MSSPVTLIAIVILLLGAILSFLLGVRALQASRSLANFRLRQGRVSGARRSFVIGFLLVVLAASVFAIQNGFIKPLSIFPVRSTATAAAPAPTVAAAMTATSVPAATPTFFALTPTPAFTSTAAATSTPALPVSIEAIFESSITPAADVQIGTLRFSTELRDLQPVGPGNSFRNPIKRMYAVFSYLRLQPGTQWSALWYRDGQLKYFETRAWQGASTGLGNTVWEQPAEDWLPGTYEVRIFVGTQWKTSSTFSLRGEPAPATATPTLAPSRTPRPAATSTHTRTPAATPTTAQSNTPRPGNSPTIRPSSTNSATPTRTSTATLTPSRTPSRTPFSSPPARLAPLPSASASASPSATSTATATATATGTSTRTPTALPTQTPLPSSTPTEVPSATPSPTATKAPSLTPSPTASATLTPSPEPSATATPATIAVKVYFTDRNRLAGGTPPYEEAVLRQVPSSANPIASVLDAYFTGPNAVEQSQGLSAVWNGFIGYRRIEFADGLLRVYLIGYCRSDGGGYNIAVPLTLSLKQFPGISYVKLYDEYERTRDPLGQNDSAPDCAVVTFTPSPTITLTASSTPTLTPTVTRTKTPTPLPSATASLTPTPLPSSTPTLTLMPIPSRTPTRTPVPTATRLPSETPSRTPAPTHTPTRTPSMTASPRPSATPSSTATPLPSPTWTSTATPLTARVDLYFTNSQRLSLDAPPFDERVSRDIPSSDNPIAAVLDEYFRGPSAGEQSRGLTATWNGFIGYQHVEFSDGILRVYLRGRCQPGMQSYNLSQPLTATLRQFSGVHFVKLYDEYGHTRDPLGASDSAPVCLDMPPTATATETSPPTLTATGTATATQTPSRTPSPTATASPTPTRTQTPLPTATLVPTSTATLTATSTLQPAFTATLTRTLVPTATLTPTSTASLTPRPTRTPLATLTRTTVPSATLVPTSTASLTPRPTLTPTATVTRTPVPSSTATPRPTFTRTPLPSSTPTAFPTATATLTHTLAPTASLAPTATSSSTPRPTPTYTATVRPTFTPTATTTRTPVPTATLTRTPLPTATLVPTSTATVTVRPTSTSTPVPTSTFTPLPTATSIPSSTPRPTQTSTATNTHTPLPTATLVPTLTPTRTATQPPTSTRTPLPTPTLVPTSTLIPTATLTVRPVLTPTATRTPTLRPTQTVTPSRTPTHTPTASATAIPSRTPTRTLTPTATLTPTRTPTLTPDPNCNRAGFAGDVTIPDNTAVGAGSAFTKTWRIRNEGVCAWTTAYKLVFVNGSNLGSPASMNLPSTVAPGQGIDLAVTLVAPRETGSYQGFWLLQAPDGRNFGVGPAADQPVWVKVNVVALPTITLTATLPAAAGTPVPESIAYDFAANACAAEWSNGSQAMPCPGSEADPAGALLLRERAVLEDGSQPGPALLVLPASSVSSEGVFQGIYPEIRVQPGDHLRLTVGCEQGATACSVLFNVGYQDGTGAIHGLWSLGEFYDEKSFALDLDLAALAGQDVGFILGVSSLGSPAGDRAIWAAPKLVHMTVPAATPTPSPTSTEIAASVTPTIPATNTPTLPAPSPTATPIAPPEEQGPASLFRQILDAIASFFRKLIGQ